MAGKIDCFGATHVGQKRATNEDQFLIADLNKSMHVHHTSLAFDHHTRLFGNSQGKLLLVADGMGGHEAGERASTLAVDSIATYALNTLRWYFRLDEQSDDDFQDDLKAAMEHCQATLSNEMAVLPQRHGMGTTLTMAFVIWPRLYVVHVGDSRCYLSRDGKLKQLTRDHTIAQLYRENIEGPTEGEPDDKDAAMGHVLWNVIGGPDDELKPEVYRATLQIGDTLLLCTDGLTRHVSNDTIAERLRTETPAKQLCEQFIDLANDDGGRDNITVSIARFCEPKESDIEEADIAIPDTAPSDAFADTAPSDAFADTTPLPEPNKPLHAK